MGRKTGLLRTQERREEFASRARAAMLRYIELSGKTKEELAQRQHVTERTIQNRLESPGKMQLEDIWELSIILNCPLGELCGGELPEELIGSWMAAAVKKSS